ncbi:MAG: Gfo/Idh/MocA family oxidoreductase [Oscillospiraceae bacterium]|nr:Gfo/Idh/MocA family oxidoreductase [Oscillospiraceae bacterium]
MKKIGFVGVGDISGIYLKNITEMFGEIEIAGLCDIKREKAERAAQRYGITKIYGDMHELFADPDVDIVLNITRPYEHFAVTKAALEAGKNVYSEKPLAATLEEGRILKKLADEKGLVLGGAPDTFLGAGIQTCRKLIDDGYIGTPVGAAAFMICRGHETWHPDPEFYYKHGGGPMLDMGPYYLTALVNLMGPVKRVAGMAKASYPTRLITSEPLNGTVVSVDVPTYITGLLEFKSGAVGTIFTTFDVKYAQGARLEVYGSQGTLSVPDPNNFGGQVKLLRAEEKEYRDMPLCFGYPENSRALGLADMAKAMETGRKHRANSEQTLHVLEIMSAIETSGREGRFIEIESVFERGEPMISAGREGFLD